MLTGTVRNLQAWVAVEILDQGNRPHRVEVLLDTGFDGHLKLLATTIQELELVRSGYRYGELADGTMVQFMSYDSTVLWDGQPRFVSVIEADADPLLGMELLLGSRVTLDVHDGGAVTVDVLP